MKPGQLSKIRDLLGTVLHIIAFIMLIGGGFVSLFICYGIVREVFGQVVAFLILLIFPVVFAVAPVYALIAWGNWFPLVFIYGVFILAGTMMGISRKITGEEI